MAHASSRHIGLELCFLVEKMPSKSLDDGCGAISESVWEEGESWTLEVWTVMGSLSLFSPGVLLTVYSPSVSSLLCALSPCLPPLSVLPFSLSLPLSPLSLDQSPSPFPPSQVTLPWLFS